MIFFAASNMQGFSYSGHRKVPQPVQDVADGAVLFDATMCRWRDNGGARTRLLARRCLQTGRGWLLRGPIASHIPWVLSCSESNHKRSSSVHLRCQLWLPKVRSVSHRLTNCRTCRKTVPNPCIVECKWNWPTSIFCILLKYNKLNLRDSFVQSFCWNW